jgi:hypothetical protein
MNYPMNMTIKLASKDLEGKQNPISSQRDHEISDLP